VAAEEVFGVAGHVDLDAAERPGLDGEEVVDGRGEARVVVHPHVAVLEPQGPQVDVQLGELLVTALRAEQPTRGG
jgi:hypothetical protein